jgi:hypothetical protein
MKNSNALAAVWAVIKQTNTPASAPWAIAHFLAFVTLGLAATLMPLTRESVAALQDAAAYTPMLYAVLAVGIYGCVYGVDLEKLASDRSALLLVVTAGVAAKIVFIAATVYLLSAWIGFATGLFLALAFAVIVAQIDPLSVSALTSNKAHFSPRAKNFLLVWASFDDPVTVVFASIIVVLGAGRASGEELTLQTLSHSLLHGGGANLLLNLLLAAVAYALFVLLRAKQRPLLQTLLLFAGAAIAVWQGLILSVALLGLFLRPDAARFRRSVEVLVPVAYTVAVILLGINLAKALPVAGTALALGLILAAGAVFAQVFAATVFAATLSSTEKSYLRWAQQNGITAVILALYLSGVWAHDDVVSGAVIGTVAVAIVLINVTHMIAFWSIDYLRALPEGKGPSEKLGS